MMRRGLIVATFAIVVGTTACGSGSSGVSSTDSTTPIATTETSTSVESDTSPASTETIESAATSDSPTSTSLDGVASVEVEAEVEVEVDGDLSVTSALPPSPTTVASATTAPATTAPKSAPTTPSTTTTTAPPLISEAEITAIERQLDDIDALLAGIESDLAAD